MVHGDDEIESQGHTAIATTNTSGRGQKTVSGGVEEQGNLYPKSSRAIEIEIGRVTGSRHHHGQCGRTRQDSIGCQHHGASSRRVKSRILQAGKPASTEFLIDGRARGRQTADFAEGLDGKSFDDMYLYCLGQ